MCIYLDAIYLYLYTCSVFFCILIYYMTGGTFQHWRLLTPKTEVLPFCGLASVIAFWCPRGFSRFFWLGESLNIVKTIPW